MELYSKENEVLFALLAFELFGKEMDADGFGADFGKVVFTANEHAVGPLLYAGLKRLDGVSAEVLEYIEKLAVRATLRFERVAKVQSEVLRALSGAGVRAAVLKGMSAAAFYRHPEVRLTGDIDILIDDGNMEVCRRVLSGAGFSLEEENALHVNFRKGGVLLEVHRSVSYFPENPKADCAKAFLSGTLDSVSFVKIGGYEFPAPDRAHQMLCLLAHMERHMGAGGIGLRQLCDWAMFISAIDEDENGALRNRLEECGLLKFARVITGVCVRFLGLKERAWLGCGADDLTEETMKDIMTSGNFRAQYRNRPLASAMIEPYDLDGDGKRRVIKTFFRRTEQKMRSEYPWAKSKAWVPLFGVFFLLKRGFSERRNLKGVLNAFSSAKEREKLLRKLELYK